MGAVTRSCSVTVHILAGEVHPGDGQHRGESCRGVSHRGDIARFPGAQQLQRCPGGGQCP